MDDKKDDKTDDIKIRFKVYPYVDENRKGNHVGDIKAVLIGDNLPFTYFDQVDHMMYNLFGYVRDRDTSPKEKKEKKLYFDNNKTYEITYNPPKLLGGKRSKTIKKSKKMKKTKKNKRKTYKR